MIPTQFDSLKADLTKILANQTLILERLHCVEHREVEIQSALRAMQEFDTLLADTVPDESSRELPEGLPPLPPGTRYGGQLKDYDGDVQAHVIPKGNRQWTRLFFGRDLEAVTTLKMTRHTPATGTSQSQSNPTMNITHPPIVTRARHGLPTSLNRRKRPRYWTPWHSAATALGLASIAAITVAIINLNQN